ncbi:MAG: class I SAM-dependent rRNA methyltransferase [Elusimicrobiales bacterium]
MLTGEAVRLQLNPGQERRLEAGHQWVFSNELKTVDTSVPPGSPCEIISSRGKRVAVGFFNPRSLIAARVLSRGELEPDFISARIRAALEYRKSLGLERYGRIVFSEADFLPGLVIDAYGPLVVAEILCAGMERQKPKIIAAINEVLSPKSILFKNSSPFRALEGLSSENTSEGHVPEEAEVHENGLKYSFSATACQKTGFYYDQRDNRAFLAQHCSGRKVLDLYCYTGGFALAAAAAGAAEVWGVDSSQPAVDAAIKNAELNKLRASFRREDAERVLAALKDGSLPVKPDVIVLDPPNLVKSRKNLGAALRLYGKLNESALRGLPSGGLLATASCSHHVSREEFVHMLRGAAVRSGRRVSLVELRGQAKDHPVLLAMPETEYLHFALLRAV